MAGIQVSIGKTEAGESGIQGNPGLHSKSETSLDSASEIQ